MGNGEVSRVGDVNVGGQVDCFLWMIVGSKVGCEVGDARVLRDGAAVQVSAVEDIR